MWTHYISTSRPYRPGFLHPLQETYDSALETAVKAAISVDNVGHLIAKSCSPTDPTEGLVAYTNFKLEYDGPGDSFVDIAKVRDSRFRNPTQLGDLSFL